MSERDLQLMVKSAERERKAVLDELAELREAAQDLRVRVIELGYENKSLRAAIDQYLLTENRADLNKALEADDE